MFVSAPYDTSLGPLLDGLRRAGVDAYVTSDTAVLGADLIETVRSAIDAADLVLVVLTSRASLTPVFEAGMATALGKQVLMVADPDVALPVDLGSVVVVQTRLDDPEPVVAAVQEVARREPRGVHPRPPATGRALDAGTAERLVHRLESEDLSGRGAVELLLEAINGTGAVAVEADLHDRGWDIGVWSDDLASIGANPLVVEIKPGLVQDAVRQLHAALAAQHSARLGLLVYLTESSADALRGDTAAEWFPVLAISLRDLLEQLQSTSFAGVIQHLRNRAVHGLPAR
ncbi:hypothetical protein ACI797_19195 [Geodermatophilus sp. SYSU D00691]